MTFISFAQNFEDIMLWRALKHVDTGFYIDVGAADPDEGSVTKAFYDRGWHGINIEPEPDYASSLRASRPRDINLEVAVGEREGKAIFHRIAGTGLSTFYEETASKHQGAGYPKSEAVEIDVTTIDAIWRQHDLDTVHFLKIDVEGAEREVVLGANLKVHRPWIVIVEATLPFSGERNSSHFQKLVIDSGYKLRWFDGLNEWYIAVEHDQALKDSFLLPPNFFDNFVMSNYLAQAGRADAAEAQLGRVSQMWEAAQRRLYDSEQLHEKLRAEMLAAEAQLEHVSQTCESLRAEMLAEGARAMVAEQRLAAILDSNSWKVTAPLRWWRSKYQ
ncbi:FkbM family methyltransferase [Rhizobium jaguaris]|uniref:FkbM family methyltransferase n=1 Tax=Rhizobium jaguaris TaxID=1312183 RepID=A0A387G251_9HYPH|nr:FkbM family methyltransferase [Rhizobium jaguaris]AYG62424.1 FkbM family methyltransferase [Rhizobium jaguaris]